MKKYTGWMIAGVLVSYLLSCIYPSILIIPVFLAWLVPLLKWHMLGKRAVQQTLLLLIVGFTAISFSAAQGVFLGLKQIFAVNLPLLAMFVAIAFLSLTNRGVEDPTLPKGNSAVVKTALGTHFLGAVINMSAMFLFGDRLQKNGTLSREQLIILGRSFCAAAWWSPFFIATGVALTHAPEMNWKMTLVPGVIMSTVAISYSIIEVCYFSKKEFRGYPLRGESLIVPVFLASVVLVVHHFWHSFNILLLICLVSPVGAFLFMKGRPRLATINHFISNRIETVNNQFALFLAAGVFSTGLKSIIQVYPSIFSLEGSSFTPTLFMLVLAAMILIGIVGVHPIVSIAIVSPLLIPLNPDHSQLGFLFLSSWAISTGTSPLSGVGLALVSRYKASPRLILQSNWHYALLMCAIASLMNVFFFTP